MNCPRCNHVNDDNASACSVCGAQLRPEQAQSAGVSGGQPDMNYAPQNNYYPPAGQYNNFNGNYNNPNMYNNGNNPNMYNNGWQGMPYPNVMDKPDTLMNVLSFFIPLVGIILYFLEKDKTPIKAKAALKWSIISIVVSFVVGIIWGVAMVFIMMASGGMYY